MGKDGRRGKKERKKEEKKKGLTSAFFNKET